MIQIGALRPLRGGTGSAGDEDGAGAMTAACPGWGWESAEVYGTTDSIGAAHRIACRPRAGR